MRHPRTHRRRLGVAFVVAAAAAGIPMLAAPPASAVPSPIEQSASVTVESFPDAQNIELDVFDDQGGTLVLDEVTVKASVEGELEGSVENLSDGKNKVYVGLMDVGIVVNGTGVTDLSATATSAAVYNLIPGSTSPLTIGGSDSSVATITDPEALADFVGTPGEKVIYVVDSEVSVDINGPAPYKTTGVGGGLAKVEVRYDFRDLCVETPEDPKCDVPEPPCVDKTDLTKITPLGTMPDEVVPLTGGGTITLSGLDTPTASGEAFDWTSTVPVHSIDVKGGPGFENFPYPGGATAGTGLHAPAQVADPTKNFDVEYIIVCAEPEEICPPKGEDPKDPKGEHGDYPKECEPECPKVEDPKDDKWGEGYPDECEPECPKVEDPKDDKWGEGYPDECEPECPKVGTWDKKGGHDPECEPECPDGTKMGDKGQCEPECPDGTKMGDKGQCEPECPEGTTMGEDGQCAPPPPPPADDICVDPTGLKFEPVQERSYANGTFTITKIYDNGLGQQFDWTSTVPVLKIGVKGGPRLLSPKYYPYPGGSTGDTGLHSPFNSNSGKWYGLSHICVEFGEAPKDEPKGDDPKDEPKDEPKGQDPKDEPKEEDPKEEPKEEPAQDQEQVKEQPPVKVEQAPASEEPKATEDEPEPKDEPKEQPTPEAGAGQEGGR